jgi:hypothetical protein
LSVRSEAPAGVVKGLEGYLLNVLLLAIVAIWAVLEIVPAQAQGNIDAGKTPAQIFGDTCSACHRSARELRRTSSSFLRTHYTTGTDEAAAMANYLANLGPDPRAAQPPGQPKRPPADIGKPNPDAAKQNPRPPAEQAKAAQSQPKAKANPPPVPARPAPALEEKPPERPPELAVAPDPVLEPFEE